MVGRSTEADIGVHCQPAVQSHSHRGTQNLNFRLADYPLSRIGRCYGVTEDLSLPLNRLTSTMLAREKGPIVKHSEILRRLSNSPLITEGRGTKLGNRGVNP